jgi:hypothetical protein
MFKCLKTSLDIDVAYSVNSFIYTLRKLPILKDLLTDDSYSSKTLKTIIKFIGIILSLGRLIFVKFLYFFIIFVISYKLFPKNLVSAYYHIYFLLMILGMFINNKLLNTSKKKYFSLILFNMDATKFLRAQLFFSNFINLLLNSICIFFFGHLISAPIIYSLALIVLTLCVRIVGEALNIMYYKKYNYIWYSNTKLYFTILLVLLGLCLLPYLNVYISINIILLVTIIFILLSIPSLIYLLNIKDYKLIYKQLTQVTNIMDSKNEKDYLKQAMVDVKDKDKIIDNKKIQGKKGYDLFNTIFFERHKEILLRSAKKYSLILICIYLVLSYLTLTNLSYSNTINKFLNNNLAWFVIIMYFINRGSIITQAMFFNCDHAMLKYNFYREEKTIIGLFKKRLTTVIKVNLLPAFIIGFGNSILLILSSNYNIITIVSMSLFIIFLSIFFSVHYLVIYYLLQPYNKDLEVRKLSYSLVILLTYIISYQLTDLVINSLYLSVIGVVITVLYIIISLLLVKKFAPQTFRLN